MKEVEFATGFKYIGDGEIIMDGIMVERDGELVFLSGEAHNPSRELGVVQPSFFMDLDEGVREETVEGQLYTGRTRDTEVKVTDFSNVKPQCTGRVNVLKENEVPGSYYVRFKIQQQRTQGYKVNTEVAPLLNVFRNSQDVDMGVMAERVSSKLHQEDIMEVVLANVDICIMVLKEKYGHENVASNK